MDTVDEVTAAYLKQLLESAPPIPLDAVNVVVRVLTDARKEVESSDAA